MASRGRLARLVEALATGRDRRFASGPHSGVLVDRRSTRTRVVEGNAHHLRPEPPARRSAVIAERLKTARRAALRHATAADHAGFQAHEQALTEIVLTRNAPVTQVWTYTQREEARTGADWLWWWRSGGEWFGALVQAKRNKPRLSMPWYDFGYRTGSGHRQIDLLLGHARNLGVPAVYVLYNYPRIDPHAAVGTPCCVAPNEGGGPGSASPSFRPYWHIRWLAATRTLLFSTLGRSSASRVAVGSLGCSGQSPPALRIQGCVASWPEDPWPCHG